MSQILIFHTKYGPRYFKADTQTEISSACRVVLKERVGMGWYQGKDLEEANAALKSGSFHACHDLFKKWTAECAEYEHIELEDLEVAPT